MYVHASRHMNGLSFTTILATICNDSLSLKGARATECIRPVLRTMVSKNLKTKPTGHCAKIHTD